MTAGLLVGGAQQRRRMHCGEGMGRQREGDEPAAIPRHAKGFAEQRLRGGRSKRDHDRRQDARKRGSVGFHLGTPVQPSRVDLIGQLVGRKGVGGAFAATDEKKAAELLKRPDGSQF